MKGESEVYTHRASDFQSNILVKNEAISGTLKSVEGITEFPEGEQDGHFLALALTAKEGTTIKTKVINGVHDEVTVEDGFCLYRITDKDNQKIQVNYEGEGVKLTSVYDLSGLVME